MDVFILKLLKLQGHVSCKANNNMWTDNTNGCIWMLKLGRTHMRKLISAMPRLLKKVVYKYRRKVHKLYVFIQKWKIQNNEGYIYTYIYSLRSIYVYIGLYIYIYIILSL